MNSLSGGLAARSSAEIEEETIGLFEIVQYLTALYMYVVVFLGLSVLFTLQHYHVGLYLHRGSIIHVLLVL